MRLLSLLSAAALCGCTAYQHTAVSGGTLNKMQDLTLSEAESQRILSDRQSLPVGASGPSVVHVPMLFNGRLPTVMVGINGQAPKPMIIDTGASLSVMEASTAVDAGLRLLPAHMLKLEARGIAGTEAMRAGIAQLRIGDLQMHNMPILVRTHEHRFSGLGGLIKESMGVDLLGIQALRSSCSWVRLDYRNRIVTFGLRGQSPTLSGPRAWSVPLRLSRGVASIDLSSGGHSWETVVDTGSSFGIEVNTAMARRLGVLDKARPVGQHRLIGIGGFVDAKETQIRAAVLPEIGGFGDRVLATEIAINPNFNLCGSYFLQNYRVTFDFQRMRLWLEK
jgi:predicted aspartyl protease